MRAAAAKTVRQQPGSGARRVVAPRGDVLDDSLSALPPPPAHPCVGPPLPRPSRPLTAPEERNVTLGGGEEGKKEGKSNPFS